MGRKSDHSESPVRGGSPRRRRDQSPARRHSSHKVSSPVRERTSTRHTRSPKHARSRSPVPVREKPSSRARSPKHTKEASPASRSPSPRSKRLRRSLGERETEKTREREHVKNYDKGGGRAEGRGRDSGREIPSDRRERREIPSEREPEKNRDKGGDRDEGRGRDSGREIPSDRRERREIPSEREPEKNHDKGGDRDEGRGRASGREVPSHGRERRSGRDAVENGSSRLSNGRSTSTSPLNHNHRSRHRSRSPPNAADNKSRDEVSGDIHSGVKSRRAEHGDEDADSVAKMKAAEESLEAKEKQKPSFELSGKLAAETNRVRGITLMFTEPPDARKPSMRWRLYVFKGGEVLNEPLYVHRQSCYLFGRERRVADIPTDHPSCSKQHAILQYRQVEVEQPDGMMAKQVRPYVMDLGSTNGTFINDSRIEPQRYYELFEKDTLKFGNSSREYVLLHENSAE